MTLQARKICIFKQIFPILRKRNFSFFWTGSLTNSNLYDEKKIYSHSFVKNAKLLLNHQLHVMKYLYSTENTLRTLDSLSFNSVCSETLDSLSEYFEELIESVPHLKNADVTYSDGVLTVHFGQKYGTYVINRQTPNLQIWLSSPTSGPKRYDFLDGTWIYRHDNTTLHSLLDKEIKEIINQEVEFAKKCLHAKLK